MNFFDSFPNFPLVVAAYLELALKIYLRIKSDGQPIHRRLFDDKHDPL